MSLDKITNFVNLVLPVLVLQFLEQDNLRYNCNFSDCSKNQKSFASKFGFVQHLCLKHTNQLPGGGLFLLQRQEKTLARINQKNVQNEFKCKHCGKLYKRKDAYLKHEISCISNDTDVSNENKEIVVFEENFATIVLD